MGPVARILAYALIGGCIILTAEMGSYIFCSRLVPSFLLSTPPYIDETEFELYKKVRDPILGWPTRAALDSDIYDMSGSRPIPAFPEPGGECVTLYGDSFVYGDEVSHEEAWSNVLASRLGCRVANFGVSAYGTDQALLRFEGNPSDRAPITILGIFPHDILRNITQYYYFLNMTNSLGFKPRFVINDAKLELIPLPDLTYKQIELIPEQLEQVFPQDGLLPGNGLGPVPNQFPYMLAVWRLLTHERVHNWIWGLPSWQSVMTMDHNSQALPVTLEIVRRFIRECDNRNKRCLVALFPTSSSYGSMLHTERDSYDELIMEFTKDNISYLDLTVYFINNLRDRSFCEILIDPASCDGHLNAEGNSLVARAVEEHIHALGAEWSHTKKGVGTVRTAIGRSVRRKG